MLNPLMVKDVKMGLRHKRAALLQLVFLGACCLTIWILWPEEGVYSLSSESAHHLFTVLGMGQLALVALFAPAFTSSAFTMEKERNTFDLLYGTMMSPIAIVWGKIAGALAFLILIVLSSIPIISTCFILGGISGEHVEQLYIVLVLTGLMFGIIGLTMSVLCTSTFKSVILTYVIIGTLSALVVVPALLLMGRYGGWFKILLHNMRSISPFTAMASVVQPGLFETRVGDIRLLEPYTMFVRFSVVVSVALGALLFFLLRKCPSPRSRARQVFDPALAQRLTKWPFYLLNPLSRRRMIGPLFNPVLIKELRTMLFGRIVYLVRGFYLCIVVSLLLTIMAARGSEEFKAEVIATVSVSFQMALILLVAPIFSAPLISSEVESDRLDLLRLTRLTSLKIISGKFQAVMIPLALLMIATLPPYLALGRIKPELIPGLVRSSVTLVATLFFICSAGMFFSSVSKRTSTSLAATYMVVVLTCVITLLGLLAQARFSTEVLEQMFVVNPVVTILSEIGPDELQQRFDLWLPNLRFLLIAGAAMLALAAIRVRMLVRPK